MVKKSAHGPKQQGLKNLYHQEIKASLTKKFAYKNVHQVPRILKVTINMSQGGTDKALIAKAAADLEFLAAQKPVTTYVRRSEAGFKIRAGWPIGTKVTLRADSMYQFLERLLYISLPLARDFRGLNPRSFDGRGNYSFGIRDQSIFREIPYDQIDAVRGMDITITTSAQTNEEAYALLQAMGFPFAGSKKADADKEE